VVWAGAEKEGHTQRGTAEIRKGFDRVTGRGLGEREGEGKGRIAGIFDNLGREGKSRKKGGKFEESSCTLDKIEKLVPARECQQTKA